MCEPRSCFSAVKILLSDGSYRTVTCAPTTNYGTLLSHLLERLDPRPDRRGLYELAIHSTKSDVHVPGELEIVNLQEGECLYLSKKSKILKVFASNVQEPVAIQTANQLQISHPLSTASGKHTQSNKTLVESFARAWSTGESLMSNDFSAVTQQRKRKVRKSPRVIRQLCSPTIINKEAIEYRHLTSSAILNHSSKLERSASEATLCHPAQNGETPLVQSTSHGDLLIDGLGMLDHTLSTSDNIAHIELDFSDNTISPGNSPIEYDTPHQNLYCSISDLSTEMLGTYSSEQKTFTDHEEQQNVVEAQSPSEVAQSPPKVPPRASSATARNYSSSDERLVQEGRKLQLVLCRRTGTKRNKKTSLQSAIQQFFSRKSILPTAAFSAQGSKSGKTTPSLSRSQTSSAIASLPPLKIGITPGGSHHSSSPNLYKYAGPSEVPNSHSADILDEVPINCIKFCISSCESINDQDLDLAGTRTQSLLLTQDKKDCTPLCSPLPASECGFEDANYQSPAPHFINIWPTGSDKSCLHTCGYSKTYTSTPAPGSKEADTWEDGESDSEFSPVNIMKFD